jgi:hypothetical protein
MSAEPTEPTWLLPLIVALLGSSSWFGYEFATATLRPCQSSFEGGCGYGKVFVGALSFLCALTSSWSAVTTAIIAKKRIIPPGLVWLITSLALPGALYAAYCAYVVIEYLHRT